MDMQKKISWFERVEEIVDVLEGSAVGELQLTEGGTEIIIRRKPNMVMTAAPALPNSQGAMVKGRTAHADQGVAIVAPLTGVYYSAASPTSPAFVSVGDVVQAGQVVALVEAMKVFNEITAEVAGRVVALVATNGNVVQKNDVLLRIEPV